MNQKFTLNKQQLFNIWSFSYDWLFPSIFYQAVHQRLLEYVDLPTDSRVLDLGCGTGRLLERLATHYPNLYGTGCDFSPQMLRVARRNKLQRQRLIYIEGKADALPFTEGQFDAVFNTISFLHYPYPDKVFSEVARVLKTGGTYYLVDTTVKNSEETHLKISPQGIRFYSPQKRENLGHSAGLQCSGHHYLISSVLLSIFVKP
ncbi:MAG: class I SAM-dependent methyltransferase [Cyanobacteria bacterium P01_A01_bin.45]